MLLRRAVACAVAAASLALRSACATATEPRNWLPPLLISVNTSTPLKLAQSQARAAAGGGRRVTLQLQPGIHALTDGPLVLGPEDSGIAWTGASGAVISGGVLLPLTMFEPVPASDPIAARLPATAGRVVVRADVSAYRHSFTAPDSTAGIGLADGNGVPLTAARWPNRDAADSTGVTDGWATTGVGSNASGFRFPDSAPLPANVSGTVAHGFWWLDWSSATLPVTALQDGFAFVPASKVPPYVKEMGKGKFPSQSRFFFLNQPEFLDQAGEWWIDRVGGHLYLLPPAKPTASFYLSMGATLFEFKGASSAIVFRGLTMVSTQRSGITCGTDDGPGHIVPCGAQSVEIDNCSLLGMGNTAIVVIGGANWSLTNSIVRYTGGVSVLLDGGNYSDLSPSAHLVTNCTITDFNRNMGGFLAGLKITGVGTEISNNEIARGAAQALLWSGNNHKISDNVIHDACMDSFDCGAIYESERNWAMRGTVISGNLIYNIGRPETVCNSRTSQGRHAIYLDALSMGFTVRGNVVVQSAAVTARYPGGSSAIVNNGGRDSTIDSNLCVGWGTCVSTSNCGITWYGKIMGAQNWSRQLASLVTGLANPVFTKQYPQLAQLSPRITSPLLGAGGCSEKRSCPPAPYNNDISHNAAVNSSWWSGMKAFGGRQVVAGGAVTLPLEKEFPASRFAMQSNGNLNGSAAKVGFAMADPMAMRCWKLRTDSPLRTWLGAPVNMAKLGTPGWQHRWPCKTDDAAAAEPDPQQLLSRQTIAAVPSPPPQIHLAFAPGSAWAVAFNRTKDHTKQTQSPLVIHVLTSTPLKLAQSQARAAAAAGGGRRVTLQLQPGIHTLTDGPLDLGPEDSGIEWTGASGAVISGGVPLPLKMFEPVPADDPVFQRLPASVARVVVRADVSAYRLSFTAPDSSAGIGLADGNGVPLTAARWPNRDAADSTGVADGWATTGVGSNASGFQYPSSAPLPAKFNDSGTVAHGFWWLDWSSATIPVTALQDGFAFVPASKVPPYVKEMGKGKFPSHSRFFFLDQPEFLDEAGEWWIDRVGGKLYLLPPAQPTASFFLSVSATLFELKGASSAIAFRGLTMLSTQRSGITCGTDDGSGHRVPCGAQSVVIDNCSLLGMGNTAIEVIGGANWSLTNSIVQYTGSVGVLLDGGNNSDLSPSGHLVTNCTITDFNRRMGSFLPGLKITGVGTRVINNEIARGAAQALLWSGNNHRISGNVIHDACMDSFDCGAIYESERDWAMRGTVISDNLIYNIGRPETVCNSRTSQGRHAIYLDALSMGFTVRGNVVVQSAAVTARYPGGSAAIVNNGGRDNTIDSNLCVGWGTCVSTSDCGITWYGRIMGAKNWSRQLVSLKTGLSNPVYLKRYPQLAALSPEIASPLLGAGGCSEKRSCPPAPYNNAISHNAAVNSSWSSGMKTYGGLQVIAGGAVSLPLEKEFPASRFAMQSNGNLNGSAARLGFAMADPVATRCWKLRSDSPLRAWLAAPASTAKVGTPGWQHRWPCKTDDAALAGRPWGSCDVTHAPFGAVGDGRHVDTAAIRSALLHCDSVLLPRSKTFLTGPLNLTSNQMLVVDGTLLASTNVSDYPQVAPLASYGWTIDSNCFPFGTEIVPGKLNYAAIVNSWNSSNVTVTGSGVIDGNGEPWWERCTRCHYKPPVGDWPVSSPKHFISHLGLC